MSDRNNPNSEGIAGYRKKILSMIEKEYSRNKDKAEQELQKIMSVIDAEKGKGKTIADALEIDEVPELVAELTPSAVKKNKLDSPYIILDE